MIASNRTWHRPADRGLGPHRDAARRDAVADHIDIDTVARATPPSRMAFSSYYQRQRILTFLNPENDPLGTGYHIHPVANRHRLRRDVRQGYMMGSQAQLEFLPERPPISICGHRRGTRFVAESGAPGLYGVVIGRACTSRCRGRAPFARLTARHRAQLLRLCVRHSGMVSGILPVVGVPLPMISYGGTSMVTLLAASAILMSLHSHRKLIGS